MTVARDHIVENQGRIPVVAHADVVVVGGGPAGISAAVAASRNGAKVILLERYPYLGGLASGGMVLVLDDMSDGKNQTVRGICSEVIERMERMGLCVVPPVTEHGSSPELYRKWGRWGVYHLHSKKKPPEICPAAAFDPDAFKRASNDIVTDAGVNLRTHSWFSKTIVEDGRAVGVICETKEGRQAIMGSIIVDASGDLDVAASGGSAFTSGAFILTTVFRLGGIDTDEAERFEHESPEEFQKIDREVKRILGGSWEKWWLKTPLPGVIWCNCPHMAGFDGLKVEDLTRADIEGRRRMHDAMDYAKAHLPGFANAYFIDVAPQLGVRQTRLLQGQYVVTKQDVLERRYFHDTVARGRDYYYPYRSFLPKDVNNMLVAGRHYSSSSDAQKISREIPPCMAMGEAVGVAAAVALNAGVDVADVDIAKVRALLRSQGADPGDAPVDAHTPELAL
ncbi:hypothetical protein HNQ96_005945 [Aminobacter lissarensis]|uniref:FAD-dependent oxidoreductase n=1 Tax=Aminobacter carboxidus TaxID=376165 RepID=A0A8E1WM44_9HYPH|nr:FAD-dependent oxidoreductase [Aminobacter lissarensis]MBB6470051.1 hypothetical protein [Aminobacter lissarensis]